MSNYLILTSQTSPKARAACASFRKLLQEAVHGETARKSSHRNQDIPPWDGRCHLLLQMALDECRVLVEELRVDQLVLFGVLTSPAQRFTATPQSGGSAAGKRRSTPPGTHYSAAVTLRHLPGRSHQVRPLEEPPPAQRLTLGCFFMALAPELYSLPTGSYRSIYESWHGQSIFTPRGPFLSARMPRLTVEVGILDVRRTSRDGEVLVLAADHPHGDEDLHRAPRLDAQG